MHAVSMYPLRFDPIYQYRIWGGRRLTGLLRTPLPDGPIGEAWLLSDRDDHASTVADGPLKGRTIQQLLTQMPEPIMGKFADRFSRFPVLLKFLDARDVLSVQVHPKDGQTAYIPKGESGKSEAWVVLGTGPKGRIYAGLKPGTTRDDLERALASKRVEDLLSSVTPKAGDAVFVQAGTVHTLCDVVVFEVQENSDVTFRLYDWDHVDPRTGMPRPLQVEQAMACIDLNQVAIGPVTPAVETAAPVLRERVLQCAHFIVWRIRGESPFTVGAVAMPRVLVSLAGEGSLDHNGRTYPVGQGDVMLLPAEVGACSYRPNGQAVCLLEVALPES
jgi:mannose-6-phosphate isomerase